MCEQTGFSCIHGNCNQLRYPAQKSNNNKKKKFLLFRKILNIRIHTGTSTDTKMFVLGQHYFVVVLFNRHSAESELSTDSDNGIKIIATSSQQERNRKGSRARITPHSTTFLPWWDTFEGHTTWLNRYITLTCIVCSVSVYWFESNSAGGSCTFKFTERLLMSVQSIEIYTKRDNPVSK